jgi:hypothetical protein
LAREEWLWVSAAAMLDDDEFDMTTKRSAHDEVR